MKRAVVLGFLIALQPAQPVEAVIAMSDAWRESGADAAYDRCVIDAGPQDDWRCETI